MKNIISILFIIPLSLSLSAQSEVSKERELQVEKNYNNEIYAVHPVFDFGNISIPSRSVVSIGLDSMAGAPSFAPALDVHVKPVAYKAELSKSGHKGMLKLDKGTTNPWHAQGGYVYSAANHFSIHGSGEYDNWVETQIADQNITEARGNIGSTYYITSDLKADIDFNYSNKKYGLYANQKANAEPTNTTTHYNTIGINLGLQTFRSLPSKWNMGLKVIADKWHENDTPNTENNLTIVPFLQYKASNTLTLRTTPSYQLSQSEAYQTAFYFTNTITGELDYKSSNVSLGLSTAYLSDSWSIWPTANLNWQLSDHDMLNASAGQNINMNSATYISKYNPYTDLSSLPILNSENELSKDFYTDKNVSVAYKNSRISNITIHGGASYHITKGDQNFNLIASDQKFELERVNYNLIEIELGAQYAILKNTVAAGLDLQYNRYFNRSITLLHRPTWKVTPKIQSQLLNNKLHLELRANINSAQVLGIENGEELKSSWRTNISLEAKYQLLDRLNIYLNADNILNDEYQVWQGYNNFGRNLSAGILIKI